MRTAIGTIAVLAGLIVLGAAGFIYSGAYYIGADEPHWSITAWLLAQARDRSIRAHASGMAVPDGLDEPAKIIIGVSHYSEHCAVCHGAPGVERSDLADGMYPLPPSLADAARVYTPGELFWIIKHGIRMTGMPSWSDHSDDELWATVALIEKLPGMTEDNYAKLVAISRSLNDSRHSTQSPDHDHPTGHQH